MDVKAAAVRFIPRRTVWCACRNKVIVGFTPPLSRDDSWLWRAANAANDFMVSSPPSRTAAIPEIGALDGFITFNPRSVLAVPEVDQKAC